MSELLRMISIKAPALVAIIPPETWILLVVALLISAAGFYRVVYFISTGYGFSIAGMAVLSAILFLSDLTLWSSLQILALALYGLRLGVFLLKREFKSSYQAEIAKVHQDTKSIALVVKVLMWVSVSVLYLMMFSPALFHMAQTRKQGGDPGLGEGSWLTIVGLFLMFAALIIETLADQQKSAFKQKNPGRFCDTGLYRFSRFPNYSGEMLFWIGQFVSGLIFYQHPVHWVLALLGLLGIELVMIGSARRLELKQDKSYGEDPAYQEYVKTVPVLTPGLPIYSVKNAKIYLG